MDYWARERAGASTGIGAAIFLAAGSAVAGRIPGAGASDQAVALFFTTHRTAILAGSVLCGFGAMFALWFIGSLRSAMRRAEGGTGRLASVAFGGGMGAVAFILLSSMLFAAAAYRVSSLQASLISLLFGLARMAFIPLAFFGVTLIVATSIVGERTKMIPQWLVLLGAVPVVFNLGAVAGIFATTGAFAIGGAVTTYGMIGSTLAWTLATSATLTLKVGHRVETNVARRRIGDMEAGAPPGVTPLYGRRATDQDS